MKNLYCKPLIDTCLNTDCVRFFDLNRFKQIFYRLSICWKSALDSRYWNVTHDRASTWITVCVRGVWGCDCLGVYFLYYIYVHCFSLLFVLFLLHCNPLSFPLRPISALLQSISPSSSPHRIILYWLYPFFNIIQILFTPQKCPISSAPINMDSVDPRKHLLTQRRISGLEGNKVANSDAKWVAGTPYDPVNKSNIQKAGQSDLKRKTT